MNKVFVLPAGEDWIVDRFVKEWNDDNSDITTQDPRNADVIWLLASWCWKHLPYEFLSSKKVITTVHHIVPEKFGDQQKEDFLLRDKITSVYHVYNQETKEFLEELTDKPVMLIDYWANQNIWKKTNQKLSLRDSYQLPRDRYTIGSFQRDTEGHDLKTPKLEKGPDLLVEYVSSLKEKPYVVLAGWRRNYVIERLEHLNIEYKYFDRPSQEVVNDLYQCLDLYVVSSRREGGPQSLIECGLLGVPVISRDVGIAKKVLDESSVKDTLMLAIPTIPFVDDWRLPEGYMPYRKLIQEL
jgi:glycosyltransferase involved in cell wall biosynthesis